MGRLTAHSENSFGVVQPLGKHLLNVACKMKLTLQPIGLGTTGHVIGILHDIGKARSEWQSFISDPDSVRKHPAHAEYGRIAYDEVLLPLPHGSGSFPTKEIGDVFFGDIADFYRYAISQVVRSHHGRLSDDVTYADESFSLHAKMARESIEHKGIDETVLAKSLSACGLNMDGFQDEFADGFAEFQEVCQSIIDRNVKHYGTDIAAEHAIAFESNLLLELLLSSLMDADWLDTQNHFDGIYDVQEAGIPDWHCIAENLEDSVRELANQEGDLNRKRSEISDACLDAADSTPGHGIYRLSVFCGGGKTLASARYAFNHAAKYGKRHVFYVIPFTSIIEQNAAVLRNTCSSETMPAEEVILEHHCNAGLDFTGEGGVAAAIDYLDNKGTVNRYDKPVVMTTQVRFLETLFSSNRQNKKLLCDYIDSEVIFDEFQALPPKVLDMFYIASEFLCHVAHANILLCSATQAASATYTPSDVSYLTGTDWNEKYANTLIRAKYIDRSPLSGRTIDTLGGIGDLIEELLERDGSCLIVVNTKQQARELFDNMKASRSDNGHVFHLSTNMHAAHRSATLDEMKRLLDAGEPVICVSTSLIEAGVDISFGSVIRYIAGFDRVVQAGGRCNRNASGKCGEVYMVGEPKPTSNMKQEQDATSTAIMGCPTALEEHLTQITEDYYRAYVRSLGKQAAYKVEVGDTVKHQTTMVNLWGANRDYASYHGATDPIRASSSPPLPPRRSMVRTAEELFEVIEDFSISIIAATDDTARELLEEYESAETYSRLRAVQRMLQQYSVSMKPMEYANICSVLSTVTNGFSGLSIEVMDNGLYYDENVGLLSYIADDELIF